MVPHIVKMASESRNTFARPNRSGGDLTRNISRRLERLETNAKASAAFATREPHIICFVDMQRRVRSHLKWKDGKWVWTYFDEHGAFREQ
jgi:hypothetical protein